MNLAAALAKALSDAHVADVFALMGNGNLRMTHHLVTDYKVHVHHARHEAAAVGGADGYARATGRVGVATVTQGPGFTNAITALITAHRARTPLVLLTSDSSKAVASLHPFAATQAFDPELVLGPIGIVTMRATTGNGYSSVLEALDYASTHQAVVVLITAAGDDGKPFTGELSHHLPSTRADATPVSDAASADEAVRKAADALLHAQRPVILAGRGAVRANAGVAIEALAEASGAALATSIKAAGLFEGNAANIGVAGGFSGEAAADLLKTTDCLLVFGASLNYFTTLRNTFFGDATIIQCDNDPSAFGRFARSDIEIPLDAARAATDILAQVRQHGIVRRQTSVRAAGDAEPDASDENSIDPRVLCRALDRLLPADRTLVVDAGHFTAFPIMYTTIARTNGLVWPIDFGAVGSSIGVAIGAAIGRADRPTVLFVGDGGFFMTLGDFDLVVRERLPLVVVCMNDAAYGSELVHFEEAGLPGTEAIFETPDLSVVARALGFQASHISKASELDPVVKAWRASDGPLFLDCSISRNVRSPIYAHI